MANASNVLLVDTNILVYQYDPRDHVKQQRAAFVVDVLVRNRRAAVSVQCLSELYNTLTRRLPERVSPPEALIRLTRLAASCRVFDLTTAAVLEGCRGASVHQLSVWDGLIWAVAKLNQVPYVLSEDFHHGLYLEGVRFQDPFAREFDEALLDQV